MICNWHCLWRLQAMIGDLWQLPPLYFINWLLSKKRPISFGWLIPSIYWWITSPKIICFFRPVCHAPKNRRRISQLTACHSFIYYLSSCDSINHKHSVQPACFSFLIYHLRVLLAQPKPTISEDLLFPSVVPPPIFNRMQSFVTNISRCYLHSVGPPLRKDVGNQYLPSITHLPSLTATTPPEEREC